jgi:polyphosphate glucokinase
MVGHGDFLEHNVATTPIGHLSDEKNMKALGIDVGGSGIKGAIVDTHTGRMVSPRYRVKTPVPPTPRAMAKVVARIVHHFGWKGLVGCGMPGPIVHGKIMTATNIDKTWIGQNVRDVYEKACGCRVSVVNDADAAGLAEMKFGAGKNSRGIVLVLTLGTGIGSALFVDGTLVPNTEFGQIELRGKIAEQRASARIRKAKGLSWQQWSNRLNEYFRAIETLLWPDLFIVGGGVSKKAGKFIPKLKTHAPVVPARLKNEAGIVGAALCAAKK